MDVCKPLAAGADIVVAHVGLTTAGSVGAVTAISLESAAAAVRAMAAAARAESPHCLVLCHGGPIANPADAAYVLAHTGGLVGRCRLTLSNRR